MPSKKVMRFSGNRTAAIGLIVVCIVATAILIAARSSEPTSAAPTPHVDTAITSVTAKPASPAAKTQKPAAVTAAKPAAAQAAAQASEQNAAEPATIVGCLVQNNDTFRLKNTVGEDAPKGRSWKSGFLKKSSKTIDVLDERHRLNLASHVGEQVSVSGMLDDKELQGTSIKRVAESCN